MGAAPPASTGKTYSGSFGHIIGCGPLDVLHKIQNGDTIVYQGPIERSISMDGEGKTTITTTIGTCHLYWGTDLQETDPLLATIFLSQGGSAKQVPMPPLKKMIIAVWEDCQFGTQQTPPTLEYEVSKFPDAFDIAGEVGRALLTNAGHDYTETPTVNVTGGGGTGAAITAKGKFGRVTKLELTARGYGYLTETPPDIELVGGGGTGAAAIAVVNGFRVVKLYVTNQGSGYTSAPTVVFTDNSGNDGSGAAATAVIKGSPLTGLEVTSKGSGYTSAPLLEIVGGGGADATGRAYILHEMDGDAILPECIYDFLTDTFYGTALSPALVNQSEFQDAVDTIRAEDLGVSIIIDSFQTAREFLGKLFPYVDGFPRFLAGQIGYHLIRPVDLGAVPHLTVDDFADEPLPQNDGYKDTWNFTRLMFTDRANKYEEGVEPYENPANARIVESHVDKQLSYPFISRRSVAKKVARRAGIKGGKPAYAITLNLLPKWKTINQGDVVKVTYAPLGLTAAVFRVQNRRRGGPDSPDVELTCYAELSRDDSHDYTPPEDEFSTPGILDGEGGGDFEITPCQPRVAILPSGLKDGKADGWLTVYNQVTDTIRNARTMWTWDAALSEYKQIDLNEDLPIYGHVVGWEKLRVNSWLLRVRMTTDFDQSQFDLSGTEEVEFFGVLGQRRVSLVAGTDTESLSSLWVKRTESGYFAAVGADMFDIEVTVGLFSGDSPAYETPVLPAHAPGLHCYFGKMSDFSIVTSDSIYFERAGVNSPVNPTTGTSLDTDLRRFVKVLQSNGVNQEAIADATEIYFDRDDTTQDPGGTYSESWGPRALSLAELYNVLAGAFFDGEPAEYWDIEDIDIALGHIHDATATDDELLLWTRLDQILGLLWELNDGIYSDVR